MTLNRYVQEKDRLQDFLVNGPNKNPTAGQPLNRFPMIGKGAGGSNQGGGTLVYYEQYQISSNGLPFHRVEKPKIWKGSQANMQNP